jgi:outer membrane protein OmpU
MHTKFLAGCAMAALTVTAGAANAQDFKVTISGDTIFQAVAASQNQDDKTRNIDFRNRFRLNITPEATGLNGALTYGARVRMRASNSDGSENYDRAFMYFGGAFGTVIAGVNTSYNDDVGVVSAPSDWRDQSDVALSFVNAATTATTTSASIRSDGTVYAAGSLAYGSNVNRLSAWRWDTLAATGNNTKLRYQSPVISGVQFAAGYTPASGAVRNQGFISGWSFARGETDVTDAWEVALKFDSSDKSIKDVFGDAVLRASFDYQGGKSNSNAATGGIGQHDLAAYQGGIQVGYAGFLVGGGLVSYGKSGLNKNDVEATNAYTWRVGAQYTTGPLMVGVTYDYSQKDVDLDTADSVANQLAVSGTRGKKRAEQFGVGVAYTLSKGLDLYAEYDYVKTKNTYSNLADKANVVTLSTRIKF